MSSIWDRMGESEIGRIIQGLLLISLSGVVLAILNALPITKLTIPTGNGTADITIIWTLTKIFAPLLMVIEGLRKMGVRI